VTVQLMSHLYSSKCPVSPETAEISVRNNTKINYQKCCLTWVSNLLEKKVRVMHSVHRRHNTTLTNRSKRAHCEACHTEKQQNAGLCLHCLVHMPHLCAQIQTLLTYVFPFPTKRDIHIEVVTMWEDKHYQKCYVLYIWVHICNFSIHLTNL